MTPILAMWTPGPLELVVLLVLVMIFFGVGKLPEVGAALGQSIKAFKEGQKPEELDVTPETETIESREVEVEQA